MNPEICGVLLRTGVVVVVTITLLYAVSTLFARHFVPDLKKGMRAEFRHKAGMISFLGFLLFVYLAIHQEVMTYLVWILSPVVDGHTAQHGEYSSTSVWAAFFTLIANFVLLGVLGISDRE